MQNKRASLLRDVERKKSQILKSTLKGGVGNFGETSSSALEFENTQPEQICHFLTEPLLQHTRTRT